MSKGKSLIRTLAVSTMAVAITGSATCAYAAPVLQGAKTYEKVNTIDISVDSVENIVYSFQASIKVQGEVEVADNEQGQKIKWADNIDAQIKSGNANANCVSTYDKASNTTTLDIYVTSNEDLLDGNTLNIGRISVKKSGSNSSAKYKILGNGERSKPALKIVTYNNKTVDYESVDSSESLNFILINEDEIKPIGGTGSSKNDPEKYKVEKSESLEYLLNNIRINYSVVSKETEESGSNIILKLGLSQKSSKGRKATISKYVEVTLPKSLEYVVENELAKPDELPPDNSGGENNGGGSNSGGSSGGGSGGGSSSDSTSNVTVKKLKGADRFETAVKISQNSWTKSDTVVIVNGEDKSMVDGLTATPLASVKNSPILLSSNDKLPQKTVEELKRLNPSKVIVIGGNNSMPNSVVEDIKGVNSKISVQRIGGDTRYQTSINIAKEIDKTNNVSKLYIGAGNGEADSLSIASLASKEKTPIVLTQKDGVDSEAEQFIKSNKVSNVYFIGGVEKISNKAIEQVGKIANKDVSKNRIAGQNRQETNAKVIDKFYSQSKLDGVVVANQDKLIDALAVGPLAAKNNSPVVLATNTLDKSQEVSLKNKNSSKLFEVGGGIASSVVDKIKSLIEK
ncbi:MULTISPECIES: cell wall-binding repeat-containing protein [unclassified Clostridioides]|uniref:cell wall-binding repeat-containing protein n=1 Tax=unclassified Clostridioides TaxID=2635829 RepID=UPI001D0FE884|nr:cell wall-binding repeat-containing protein [Clostridioides sp. ZZV14-6150]MCC0721373.1 cell wall-binding repeat-containing protein [Clostridioides sp. ZZV14-6104]MCC0729663.1 cell wall-binding repeat-containing protein [Clostridioides sp. ZZV14-6048]MCC0742017.1 cell wall-binding repeat-containing protein [Clostridioides sp. ZZV14-6044]MCC0749644.1 cell wall-binding repeat-containing protein [Clostridioides sp. ZZV13-5731]